MKTSPTKTTGTGISAAQYYKTTITFNVMSMEPIPEDATLESIYQECIDGSYSGDLWFKSEVTELTGQQAALELIKQGSDPEFFGITEDDK